MIPVFEVEVRGYVCVRANSEQEAYDKAKELDFDCLDSVEIIEPTD